MEQDEHPDRPAQFQASNLSTRVDEGEYYEDARDVDQDGGDHNMDISQQQVDVLDQQD